MEVVKIRNNVYYDRTFFGVHETIKPKAEQVLDRDVYDILIKHCELFQDMTRPPDSGGDPTIKILDSTPSGDVKVNAKGLGEPTVFTVPAVKLKADSVTSIPRKQYQRLQRKSSRFQSFMKAGELEFVGTEEK